MLENTRAIGLRRALSGAVIRLAAFAKKCKLRQKMPQLVKLIVNNASVL